MIGLKLKAFFKIQKAFIKCLQNARCYLKCHGARSEVVVSKIACSRCVYRSIKMLYRVEGGEEHKGDI